MKKKILASALALCLSMPVISVIPEMYTTAVVTVEKSEIKVFDIYLYKIHDDYIEITATSTMAEGEITVPNEINGLPVKEIGEHGLAGLQKVTGINLGENIEKIGKQAFFGDVHLENIQLTKSVKEIPDEAFANCLLLKGIYSIENVEEIGVRAFYNCQSLSDITIPENAFIDKQAFDSCKSIMSFTVPKNMTEIPDGMLSGCTSIKSLTLPENISNIGLSALPNSLESLVIMNPECNLEYLMTSINRNCTIYGFENSTVFDFAEQYGYHAELLMPSYAESGNVTGDANGDNEFNIADLITTRNFILGNGKLTEWKSADLNNDDKIDVFDFILMRQMYIDVFMLTPPVDLMAKNLTADIKSASVEGAEADSDFIMSQTDFALDIFKHELKEDTNTLVSPYSVMQALSMVANGAENETKTELENVLGMPIEQLDKYLYTQRLSQRNDENSKLSTANSIWSRDREDLIVKSDFLQKTVDYFNAEYFLAPFDDSTKDDINNWVSEKTDKMIPSVLDEAPPSEAIMYLINAIAFDSKWETEFSKDATYSEKFKSYDGTFKQTDFMHSADESYFISDENAKGFLKYYKDRKYAFVAVVPEKLTLTEYVETLTSESFNSMISNPERKSLYVSIPKFSYDFDTILNDTLIDMSMPTAFDRESADFSGLFENKDDSYISNVIHKTHIDFDEAGTKAAAATVIMVAECTAIMPKENIYFNKPFAYFIIDTDTNIPIFMGTVSDFE